MKNENGKNEILLGRRDWLTKAGVVGVGIAAVSSSKSLSATCAAGTPQTHTTTFDVKDYGAKGDGTTDDTDTICAALTALATNGGGILFFPPGTYIVSATTHLIRGVALTMKGAGKGVSIIRRKSTFATGDLFLIDAADGTQAGITIEDLRIENCITSLFDNTSGYIFHIKNFTQTTGITIRDVYMLNGYGGIWIESTSTNSCGHIRIDNVTFWNSDEYSAAGYTAYAGCKISGHCSDIVICNSTFIGQTPTRSANLSYGILVLGCDGLQIANCVLNGKIGISFYGGSGANIDDAYIDNCVIDNVSTACIQITGTNSPNAFSNIRLANSHFNVGNNTGAQSVIAIDGDADYIQILSNNINLGYTHGIIVISNASYIGGTKQSVLIANNDICENNLSNAANTFGISLLADMTGVSIVNNKIRNRSSTGHQKYGIVMGTGASGIVIQGNDLSNNETGPLYGTPTSGIIKDNLGIDDVIPSAVASAATISIPANPIVPISGTTTVSTINGGWIGRVVQIYPSTGSLTFSSSGGNILRSITASQYQMVTLVYTSGGWVIT